MSLTNGDRPHSALDRQNDGLNPHAKKRNGRENPMIDNSLESNPDKAFEFKNRIELLKMASRDYPEDCKYLSYVEMHFISGITLTAIAEMMEVSRTAATSRISRTLEFLEWYINEHE